MVARRPGGSRHWCRLELYYQLHDYLAASRLIGGFGLIRTGTQNERSCGPTYESNRQRDFVPGCHSGGTTLTMVGSAKCLRCR